MKRVVIEKNFIFTDYHYYINDAPDGPYYEVHVNGDTEGVVFINPKNSANNEYLKIPLGAETVKEAIFNHMTKKGFPLPDHFDEPYE